MCKIQGYYSTVFRNFDWDQNSGTCSTTPVKRKFITGYILEQRTLSKLHEHSFLVRITFGCNICSNVRGNLLSSLFKTLFPAFFTQRYYDDSNEPPYITHPAEPRATKGVPKLLAPRKARCVTTVASRATSAGRAPLSRTSFWC